MRMTILYYTELCVAGGVKSACKDPSFAQTLIKMAYLDLNLVHVLKLTTSN